MAGRSLPRKTPQSRRPAAKRVRTKQDFVQRGGKETTINQTRLSKLHFHQVHGSPSTSDVYLKRNTRVFLPEAGVTPKGARRVGTSYQKQFGKVYKDRRAKPKGK